MDPKTATQYDYLYDALADKFPGIKEADGKSTTFQFVQTPIVANWTKSNDPDAFDLTDATSAELGGYFIKGDSFSQSYQSLVNSLAVPAGTTSQQYRDVIVQIAQQTRLQQSIVGEARSAYAEYQHEQGDGAETFTKWLTDPFGGESYQSKMASVEETLTSLGETQASITQALDKPVSDAQKAVNPWAETMTIGRSGQASTVPLESLSGDLQGDIVRWESYKPGEYDFTAKPFTKDYVVTSPWHTTYSTKASQHCLHTSVDTKVDTSRIITDEHYKLEVRAVGANSYQIDRGTWYNGQFVHPDVEIVDGSAFSQDDFFGLNGSLHLIPETVFVLYQPSITLTISESTYEQQLGETSHLNVDWFDLFGLRFGFDGYANMTKGPDNTVVIDFAAPHDQAPQVIGITSKVAWNGSTS